MQLRGRRKGRGRLNDGPMQRARLGKVVSFAPRTSLFRQKRARGGATTTPYEAPSTSYWLPELTAGRKSKDKDRSVVVFPFPHLRPRSPLSRRLAVHDEARGTLARTETVLSLDGLRLGASSKELTEMAALLRLVVGCWRWCRKKDEKGHGRDSGRPKRQ